MQHCGKLYRELGPKGLVVILMESQGSKLYELPAWFPAWYLLEHPVVGEQLSDEAFPDTPAADAARLLAKLIELERHGNQRRLVGERERLRRSPWFN